MLYEGAGVGGEVGGRGKCRTMFVAAIEPRGIAQRTRFVQFALNN